MPESDQPTQPEEIQAEGQPQEFALWFKLAVIEYQSHIGQWIPAASTIADHLGVAASTVINWLDGKSIPHRDACFKIAKVFEIDPAVVLQAAGYVLAHEDHTVTYSQLLGIIEQDTSIPTEQRAPLIEALRDASSPQFVKSGWRNATNTVLQANEPYRQRAERIAKFVALWRQEKQDAEEAP